MALEPRFVQRWAWCGGCCLSVLDHAYSTNLGVEGVYARYSQFEKLLGGATWPGTIDGVLSDMQVEPEVVYVATHEREKYLDQWFGAGRPVVLLTKDFGASWIVAFGRDPDDPSLVEVYDSGPTFTVDQKASRGNTYIPMSRLLAGWRTRPVFYGLKLFGVRHVVPHLAIVPRVPLP